MKIKVSNNKMFCSWIIFAMILLFLIPVSSNASAAVTYAYITNSNSDTVSVIDTATNTVIETVNVEERPYGVAVTPDGKRVYVANRDSDSVSVIDTTTNKVTKTIDTADDPHGIAVAPDGKRVYVTHYDSSIVSVIDTAKNEIIDTRDYSPKKLQGIAVNPDGKMVYFLSSNSIYVIDIANGIDSNIVLPKYANSYGIAVRPDGKKAYVTSYGDGCVYEIDTDTNKGLDRTGVGFYPHGIAVSPDGKKVYAANRDSDSVSVIDTVTKANSLVTVGDGPLGIALTPDGKKVYVANHLDNTVSVINVNINKVIATVKVGECPVAFGQFICTLPDYPVANFTCNVTEGCVPLTVLFTDKSKSATEWSWDFGDGSGSKKQNPTHIYNSKGDYTVSLKVKNADGDDTKTCVIRVSPPIPLNNFKNVAVYSEPKSIERDKTSTVTVTVTGTDGDGISGASVKLETDSGRFSPVSGTTDSSGKFTSTFTPSDTGTATIKAQVMKEGFNDALNETSVEINPVPPITANVAVSSEPKSVKLGEQSTITVTVTGTDGEGITGTSVNMETNAGKVNPESGTTDSSGKFTSTFSSSDTGTATIKAQVNGVDINDVSGETSVEVKGSFPIIPLAAILLFVLIGVLLYTKRPKPAPGPTPTPAKLPVETTLYVKIEPESIPADGKSTAKVIIKIKDDKGNFVSSINEKTVELSITLGTITSQVKIPSGAREGSAVVTSGEIAGTATVIASSSPLKDASAQVNFVSQ